MTTAIQTQIRRDTATNLNAATPATGELGYDTTNKQLRLGDGATLGGIRVPNAPQLVGQSMIAANAGGTADALTLTLDPVPLAYASLQRFVFKATATNATATPTINVNALGAKTIKKKSSSGKAAVAVGDIQSGCIYAVVYDGTDMQLESVDISSSAGSGLTIIASGSFGATATQDITSIPQTYNNLVLYINGASCDTATRALHIDVDTGLGLGNANNLASVLQFVGTTASVINPTNAIWTGVTQTAAQVSHAIVHFPAYQSGAVKDFYGTYIAAATSGVFTGTTTRFEGHLVTDTTVTARTGGITGIRIKWDSTGNFDAGTYALYGYN